jgi:hypothetical protein
MVENKINEIKLKEAFGEFISTLSSFEFKRPAVSFDCNVIRVLT